MWTIAMLTAAALAGSCPFQTAPTDLSDMLVQAESAYASLDADGFTAGMDEASIVLPCVDAVIAPRLAAHYHRMIGLQHFLRLDSVRAGESMAAARSLDPEFRFDSQFLPDNHPVRDLYDRELELAPVPIPEPIDVQLVFDGSPAVTRPGIRAAILQVQGADGVIQQTVYLHTADPLPDYSSTPLPEAEPGQAGAFKPARGPLIAGLAAVGLSGLSFGGAMVTRSAYTNYSPNRHYKELDNLDTANRVFVVSSGVSGVVGLGAIGTSVILGLL